MSTSSIRGRRGYHHGDLREALVEAAMDALAERGEAHVGLREVARRAGVSPAAPYRHFKSQADLLAAVAAAGFRRFRETLLAAQLGLPPSHHLAAMGQGYVSFARDNPALFRLMFSSGPDRAPDDDLKAAADAAFAPLVDAALRETSDDPFETALAAWALVHGLAHLLNDGHILSIDAGKAESLVAAITTRFVAGLRATARLPRGGLR
jgi:AcrR family transcriptional regulator